MRNWAVADVTTMMLHSFGLQDRRGCRSEPATSATIPRLQQLPYLIHHERSPQMCSTTHLHPLLRALLYND